jgi:hypothetical protein
MRHRASSVGVSTMACKKAVSVFISVTQRLRRRSRFFEARARSLLDRIQRAMGKTLARAGAEPETAEAEPGDAVEYELEKALV